MRHTHLRPILVAAAALFALPAHAQTEAPQEPMTSKELTIERLYASPSLNGPSPTGVKYSPDGKRVTFLKAREDDSSRYDLWSFDVETGEQAMLVDSTLLEPDEVELSEEDKALRERKRIAGRKGIVDYDWGTADTILVPLGGQVYRVTLADGGPKVVKVTDDSEYGYDARMSPDNRFVSYINEGALYIVDHQGEGSQRQVSPDAEPENAVSYGVAEFVAQEEMSRYTGYWWSSDGKYIAYTKVNESTVDVIERFDIKAEETTVIDQRYPRAGRPNAVVDLFVYDVETRERVEIDWRREDWGPATDQYLARVRWAGDQIYIQAVNRDQTLIRNLTGSAPDWTLTSFDAESQRNWVNLSHDFAVTENHILTSSEAGGYRHIKAWGRSEEDDGFQITKGDWAVDAIQGVDAANNLVYFTGYMDTPLERHLYVQRITPATFDKCPACANWQPVEGPLPLRVTQAGMSWSVTLSPDGKSFVGTSSSPEQPAQTGLYALKVAGNEPSHVADYDEVRHETHVAPLPPVQVAMERITWIEENALDQDHPYSPYLADHVTPEFGTLTAEDGQTLHYSILKPPGFDAAQQYPAIIEVYGGPHAQTVDRDWESLSDQYLARQGYVVFRLDNRGMANRGKRFEDVIFRQTGGPEVRDQLQGAEWLKSQPFIDGDRVAIQGWSYGGYMTLMTLLQAAPDVFAAAVAGAPVTDWSLYDTFYTERYMDTPQDNADGYEKSSVFYHLDRYEGELPPLLLVHGMADDNVTFDNTTRLMAAMQEKGLMFELMTYPGQRHGIRGQALQTHLMKTRMAFLNRALKRPGE